MSSWGHRTFEDDIALDWLEDLYESEPLAFFRHCLDLTDQEELSFLASIGVVCTSEMIHSILSEPRSGMPEAARVWVADQEDIEIALRGLIPDAIEALDRVLCPSSEMTIRWQDAGETHYGTWYGEVESLKNQLSLIAVGGG
ncbi:hypothetical protein LF1_09980 [Rubripirellula obstinata]|uniref:DUF4259 domain-containing protein n=1 Tax=Rubripirellula obstinata TaxID=406547 RepID=A0A5B1CBC9_9BACT|nr:DUF4259 domain-containing protein [Rubripirellula obstinata]KAA1258478.1 hypothetical protein LF1_09980 [Rubripirellula obstinata]